MGNNIACICSKNRETESEIYVRPDEVIETTKSANLIQNHYRKKKGYNMLMDNTKSFLMSKFTVEEITEEEFDLKIEKNPKILEILDKMEKEISSMRSERESLVLNLGWLSFHSPNKEEREYYYGQWNTKGLKHGLGTYITKEDSVYYGYFDNDLFHGLGVLINISGDYYYGEWQYGLSHGQGVLVLGKEVNYEGEWRENRKEGEGTETYQDGSYYKGNFAANEKSGYGTYCFSDGSSYTGMFKSSQFDGKGEHRWSDGRIYKGEFKNNKLHGRGEHLWPDGSKYVGEYKCDKKWGYGEYFWASGKYYKGTWVNNKLHGNGVISINGNSYEIVSRFGKPIAITQISLKDKDKEERKN